MSRNRYLTTSALGLVFALGGCTYLDRNEGITTFAGDSQAVNQAKMVEDPWNENAYNNEIGGDGQRLGDTVKRYKEGKKEEPQEIGNVKTN